MMTMMYPRHHDLSVLLATPADNQMSSTEDEQTDYDKESLASASILHCTIRPKMQKQAKDDEGDDTSSDR
jgi:hypothetical protein